MSVIRAWLRETLSGRALSIGAIVKLVTAAIALASDRAPAAVELLDTAADLCLMVGAAALAYRLFVVLKRRVLWRVRRKLTLSYIFIGFVPALLIITFFLLCGVLVVLNVSSYLTQSRMRALVDQAQFLAQSAALELETTGAAAPAETLRHRQAAAAARYPFASYAIVPFDRACRGNPPANRAVPTATAGRWAHLDAPATLPSWLTCDGYGGLVAYTDGGPERPGRTHVAARAVAFPDVAAPAYAVIVDVPLDARLARQIRDDTGIELGELTPMTNSGGAEPLAGRRIAEDIAAPDAPMPPASLLQRPLSWVAFLDYRDWDTGRRGTLTAGISTSIAGIWDRISSTPVTPIRNFSFGQMLLVLLGIVAALFLVIQAVALGVGLALARSITGSVHELFTGTERVRQGDFTHKIAVNTRDQLGELADSFNQMTGSIEELLQQKAEKERMEQELKIARAIQMSLLPQGPMRMPGLSLIGVCEPAREVGGDYYDFLPLDDQRVGILIADVAGKGTFAALYMAELKGVMFSLCQTYRSPRALLIEANRILSRHLDTRSFITVTYAVVDMEAMTLTYARAGHCPLIYLPGEYAERRAVQVLAPEGLVLGLKIDEGQTFARVLEEVTLPLGAGDLVVLYTDGITEASNPDGDYYGEQRLGELVEQHQRLPFEELRERILREVAAFVGPAPQHDDMTMLLLKVEDAAIIVNRAWQPQSSSSTPPPISKPA